MLGVDITTHTTHMAEVASLGERLSALRLCEPTALAATTRSLDEHGQLAPVLVFADGKGLEILDGFKRVRAARALGWKQVFVRVDAAGPVEAKLRLREAHDGRALTELEEAWLIRSLHREDHLTLPSIGARLGRHKSWVWRRLMLVESLEPTVQDHVRLGLLAARSAVTVSRLPRGNQQAASKLVMARGLTVLQTETYATQINTQIISQSVTQAGSSDQRRSSFATAKGTTTACTRISMASTCSPSRSRCCSRIPRETSRVANSS